MENATQFDLNQAIHNWREDLAGSPAFRSGDLDELESHFRDSVVALQTKGLSPREAFWVARGRLGNYAALNSEFAKVNAEQVWLNRVLWMVIGCLSIGAVFALVSALTSLATLSIYEVTKQGHLLGPFSLGVHLAVLIGLLLLAWRSGRRTNGVIWRLGARMKARPAVAGMIVFLAIAFIGAASFGTSMLLAKFMPIRTYAALMQWRWLAGALLPIFVWPVVLAWLLARTARNQVLE